jgi:hypothetical protein
MMDRPPPFGAARSRLSLLNSLGRRRFALSIRKARSQVDPQTPAPSHLSHHTCRTHPTKSTGGSAVCDRLTQVVIRGPLEWLNSA